jgi:hypothetical protein
LAELTKYKTYVTNLDLAIQKRNARKDERRVEDLLKSADKVMEEDGKNLARDSDSLISNNPARNLAPEDEDSVGANITIKDLEEKLNKIDRHTSAAPSAGSTNDEFFDLNSPTEKNSFESNTRN